MKLDAWNVRLGLGLGIGLVSLGATQIDGQAEWLRSDDVVLWQASAAGRWEQPRLALSGDVSVAVNHFALDYRPVPFDFQGRARQVAEQSYAVQASGRRRRSETFEWLASVGAHEGYTNYRSLWLAEYFRQQYAELVLPTGDRYEAPNPRGVALTGGFRWEYLPASGFLQVDVNVVRDEVAPGYEIDFEGLHRGRSRLEGGGVSVSTENVLSRRIRLRAEVRANRVSDREWRLGGELAVNAAVGETLVLRLKAGGATERPQFESWYGEMTADWTLSEGCAVFVRGRQYADSGEIEDALLFTSAAPKLRSESGAVGFRFQRERWSARMEFGRVRGDYAATNPSTDFFQNLYRDRVWTELQVAFTRRY